MKMHIYITIVILLMSINTADAQLFKRKTKNSAQTNLPQKPKLTQYQKLLMGARSSKGLINIHSVRGKIFFEIPSSILGKEMLFASKVSESSDASKAVAGQMQFAPKLIFFANANGKIYIHQKISNNICEGNQAISKSLRRNNIAPVYYAFPIMAYNRQHASFLVDATKFILASENGLGINPPKKQYGKKNTKLRPLPQLGTIIGFKSFPQNASIKCRLSYQAGNIPFSAVVHRSFVLLPKNIMKPRLADPRLNYFKTNKLYFSENEDKVKEIAYIHRWNLQPMPEDIEKYKAGKLVEPAKPIIWYVDDALPLKWKKYIKQGIEDWQPAFEAIGFKNAIIAKDFPKDNPYFNPEDIRYSCFRYIASPTANSYGPSWVDPRSGEIINATVYFYHNVLKLAHNWRFVQTAAVDPRVRNRNFEEDLMGESLRYIAAHEIGHTLGLLHNFRASYAYPVDSLRSAKFTQKYGTTASIMDYARNNYVAQPGDKGVKLTPPNLGIYDFHSVKLGYKPILEVESPEEEYNTINKWLIEKSDDPMYIYGPQTRWKPIDPASQSEALGDDAIKAGRYGIKNAKYIMDHLLEWTKEDGRNFNETKELYNELIKQYNRYITHAACYIGGAYMKMPVEGDGNRRTAYIAVSKKKQREALKFIFDEIRNQPKWLLKKEIVELFNPGTNRVTGIQSAILTSLLSKEKLSRINMTNSNSSNGYSIRGYMNDLFKYVWQPTLNEKNLNIYERNLEYTYVALLMSSLGMVEKTSASKRAYGLINLDLPSESLSFYPYSEANAISINAKEPFVAFESKTILFEQLTKIRNLIQGKLNKGNAETKAHYSYLYNEIKKALK